MTAPAFEHLAPALRPVRTTPPSITLAAAASTLALWETRARTRAALRAMPADRLPDIGVTAAAARLEAAKPFWRG